MVTASERTPKKWRLSRDSAWFAIALLYVAAGLDYIFGTPDVPGLTDGLIRGPMWLAGSIRLVIGLIGYKRNVEAAGHILLVTGTTIHLVYQIMLSTHITDELTTVVFAIASALRAWYLLKGRIVLKVDPHG